MDFFLFLIVNAVLFLRPAELVDELAGYPIYQFAILACMGASVISVIRFFSTSGSQLYHPATWLVFVQFLIACIGLLYRKDLGDAFAEIFEYAKVIIYFVLFLALVTTPARMLAVTAVAGICVMFSAIIGVLHFNQIINIPSLEMLGEQVRDPVTLDWYRLKRLRFAGMLQDPNEVAVFLSSITFLAGYQWQSSKYGILRHLWLVPIAIYLGAIGYTVSRGGLLALLSGLVVFGVYRWGGKKSLLFISLAVPAVIIAFAGRQTQIETGGSAGSRIGLWSDWMDTFRNSPLIGDTPKVVPQKPNPLDEHVGQRHCAHNSYLQGFADLGFVGGCAFLGSFMLTMGTAHRFGFNKVYVIDPELRRMHPYLMGAVGAYMVGMMTLTLNYYIATVFILGLPLAYHGMTGCWPNVPRPKLGIDLSLRLAIVGVGYLGFIYVFVRVFRDY